MDDLIERMALVALEGQVRQLRAALEGTWRDDAEVRTGVGARHVVVHEESSGEGRLPWP